MRIPDRTVLLFVAALVTGCGDAPPPLPPPQVVIGPHQGQTFRLPGDRGFAEITNEPAITSSSKDANTAIVVYFLQPDAKSPLTPTPTDVKFQLNDALRRQTKTIPLAAEPSLADPAGAGRFASKLGPYLLSETQGVLTANLGGEHLSLELSSGR
jgi:hypothetical protein